jgi:purine-binding chemotaxis protein CheW
MIEETRRLSIDELEEEDEDTQRNQYLTFRIGPEDFAIAISAVVEIVGIQPVTEVPDMPDFVRGVINLRGRVIPAIDVRKRFEMTDREYDARTCIVVVDLGGTAVGLIVDTVSEVLSIPSEAVTPPPSVQRGRQSRFVRGMGRVGDAVKILLDLDKLLLEDEQQSVASLQN